MINNTIYSQNNKIPIQNSRKLLDIRPNFAEKYAQKILYEDLPITKKIDEIKNIITNNQVIVLSGATGSGKTTQLPKIFLELGYGTKGLIGHTQPRRVAAVSIAKRLAVELDNQEAVGYQIRFNDTTSKNSYIKVMTDGILLSEIQSDKYLHKYDALIIDEAHERSLNIDFLLGYLKKILPKRPDLKLIITSATIDTQIFAKYFNNAPIIEIEGKTFPISILYKNLEEETTDNKRQNLMHKAINDAVDDLQSYQRGDVLIFLAGEREIKEVSNFLIEQQKNLPSHQQKIILPLYSRLSVQRQQEVFKPTGNQIRIILATNVAETSLTVPRIKYVIDTGLARIKRYSFRQKIEQLNIEKISKASANQRTGRCGRISSGICIRLYSELDFNAREEYTSPEILRSSLANVTLKMLASGLGDINNFDFIQKPSSKSIHDAWHTLFELGVVNGQNQLTSIGKTLASLPLDVRIARMLLAGHQYNVLKEILIITSSFGLQDIREYSEQENLAKQAHAKFKDETSGFIEKILLWNASDKIIKERQSWSEVKEWCKKNFISFLRLKEWREIHAQLVLLTQNKNWQRNIEKDFNYDNIHKAVLCGLVINIGQYDVEKQCYIGTYATKFFLHPSINLNKKPSWIVAGEIVDTSKVYARVIARINVEWIIETNNHLLKKNISSISWNKDSGQVIARENAVLYGLNIYQQKKINYINKNISLEQQSDKIAIARDLFIKQGLVQGEIKEKFKFLEHNFNLIESLEKLEHKVRKQNILVSDEDVEEFYAKNLPLDIYSEDSFKKWYKENNTNNNLLYLTKENLSQYKVENATDLFPSFMLINNIKYKLTYRFDPSHPMDGITLHIPITNLNQIDINRCDWLVEGLIKEKVIALIKTLMQKQRKYLVPVPQYAENFLDRNTFAKGHLLAILCKDIKENTGLDLTIEDFKPLQIPKHLSLNFKIVNEYGQYIDAGKDLSMLKSGLNQQVKKAFEKIVVKNTLSNLNKQDNNNTNIQIRQTNKHNTYIKNITSWQDCINDFPKLLTNTNSNIVAYLSLKDRKTHLDIEVFDNIEQANIEYVKSLKTLFSLQVKEHIKKLTKDFSQNPELGMSYSSFGLANELYEQIIDLAVAQSFLPEIDTNYIFGKIETLPKNNQQFMEFLTKGKERFGLLVNEIKNLSLIILKKYNLILKKLAALNKNLLLKYLVEDINKQLNWLINKNFLQKHSLDKLKQFPKYLDGIEFRIEKIHNLKQDQQHTQNIQKLYAMWDKQNTLWQKQGLICIIGEKYKNFLDLLYALQELRISLFAQNIKTSYPISIKRFEKQFEALIKI